MQITENTPLNPGPGELTFHVFDQEIVPYLGLKIYCFNMNWIAGEALKRHQESEPFISGAIFPDARKQ